MTEKELIEWIGDQADYGQCLVFPEELFASLPEGVARNVAEKFSSHALIKLPSKEIRFFEWLKENNREIWDDLWGSSGEEPYVVSISFLPILCDKNRGFPICDLVNNDNYYFTEQHFADKESEIFIESVKKRFLDKKELTTEQMLALEISIAPIDIWRFAYRHKVDISEAKKAADNLAEEKILIHLKNAEHLANFVQI